MLAAGQRIGDYEVETEVGGGGFATVFRVRSVRDGELYAMKVLDPEHRKHEDRRMRFLDEARIQAKRLDHPNIVKVVEILATEEVAALVLEYVGGGDLDDFIQARSEPLSTSELLELALPLLSAVGHAHANGIIHRDLKPANILLAEVDGRLVPKVTDFGVAKVLSDSAKKKQTATRAQIGTLGYMSPEQIKSPKAVTHRSDIFALGAVLYELATGMEPFGGDSDYEVMDNVVNARYRRAVTAAAQLPKPLGEAIDRALSPSPDARFDTCSDFARALSASQGRTPAREATVPAPASQPLPASGPVPRFSAPQPVVASVSRAAPPGASQTLKLGRPVVPLWLKVAGVAVVAVVFYGMFRLTASRATTEAEQPRRSIEPPVPGSCTFDGTWTLRFHDARSSECPLPTPYEVQFGLRQRGNRVTLTADPYEMFGNLAAVGGDMDRHRARDSCTVFATTELRGEQIHFSVTESKGMLNGWAASGAGEGKLDDGQCTIGGTRKKGVPVSTRTPAPRVEPDRDDGEEHVSLDFMSLAVGVDECDRFFQRTVACMRRLDILTSSARRTLIERVERTRSDIEASNVHSQLAVCRQAIRETKQVLKTSCAR